MSNEQSVPAPGSSSPKTASPEAFPGVNWDWLLHSISNKKCILCVGPDLFTENGKKLEQQLSEYLQKRADHLGIRVYPDGWFHYRENAKELETWFEVKNFYSQPFASANRIFEKLARIPFHVLLNMTPDHHLRKVFEGILGPKHFVFDAYRKKVKFEKDHDPTPEMPLVYNLLGDIEVPDSLVLTYDDLYTYLESVTEGISMSSTLKVQIRDAYHFIFLGLSFDKWYMHLFLRILQQHKKGTQTRYAPSEAVEKSVKTVIEEQYKITFVPVRMESFVDELFNQCQSRGLLREISPGEAPLAVSADPRISNLKIIMGSGDLDLVFTPLLKFLAELGDLAKDLLNGVITRKGEFESLKTQLDLGLMPPADFTTKTNQIRSGLLNLLDQAAKLL